MPDHWTLVGIHCLCQRIVCHTYTFGMAVPYHIYHHYNKLKADTLSVGWCEESYFMAL